MEWKAQLKNTILIRTNLNREKSNSSGRRKPGETRDRAKGNKGTFLFIG